MPVFNDFDFQIALARRRGANFVDIFGSRSFATPVFWTYLCEPSKRQNYGKTQHFAQFLPAKTSLLSNIDAARATGIFQYSRKLELLNFLWLFDLYLVFALRVVGVPSEAWPDSQKLPPLVPFSWLSSKTAAMWKHLQTAKIPGQSHWLKILKRMSMFRVIWGLVWPDNAQSDQEAKNIGL